MPVDFTKQTCPMPIMDHDTIQLAHGSGGKLSSDLIEKLFIPRFSNEILNRLEDQALLDLPKGRVAMSTDTFVVEPIFFPGGNIGELAINGTINDVAMSGAVPLYLSVGFIIEEGLAMADLHKILVAMEKASNRAGVPIVTGDTKVVNRGSCDKIFINTTGIGVVADHLNLSAANLRVGDKIIVSGTIADHGLAIMTCREGLSFQSTIASDTAALNGLTAAIIKAGGSHIHAMRDPTRGGVAASLNEWANSSKIGIEINEEAIPVKPAVQGACEVLGFDPLFVANEGKLLTAVSAEKASAVLSAMQQHPQGKDAVVIGEVKDKNHGIVSMTTSFGATRIVAMPIAEQLPRIC